MKVELVTKDDLEAAIIQIHNKLDLIERSQQEILKDLTTRKITKNVISSGNISAQSYMTAVGIKRRKFDQLINGNKIKTLKKKRKIYVPVGEVERYFLDPSIQ